jgi:hypothetical protein
MSQRAGSPLHDPLIQFLIRGLNPSVSSKPAVDGSSVQSWPNHSYVGIAVLRNARLRATAIHTRLSGGSRIVRPVWRRRATSLNGDHGRQAAIGSALTQESAQ